jgi:pantothenate kinase
MTPDALIKRISATPFTGRRRLVALAGPPASGKSTLAKDLSHHIPNSRVVPMDGFHLDNAILDARDLRARKGAPQTFDAQGFMHLVRRLKCEDDVYYPLFDRCIDKSINAAGHIGPLIETLIIEGNYLLLDHDIWRDLVEHWDLSIQLNVPQDILKERLVARWLSYGLDADAALARAMSNDIPNAATVAQNTMPADITITQNEML